MVFQPTAAAAQALWVTAGATLPRAALPLLVRHLVAVPEGVVPCVAKALGAAVSLHGANAADEVVAALTALYADYVVIPEPTRDMFGNLVGEMPTDRFAARVGLMQGLAAVAAVLPPALVTAVAAFCVHTALFDRDETVQVRLRVFFLKNERECCTPRACWPRSGPS